MIGIAEEQESIKSNLYYLCSNEKSYYSGVRTADGSYWGNKKLAPKGLLKLDKDVVTHLYLVYNGYKKKLFVFEKEKFENRVYFEVEQAMKEIQGKWVISFGFVG